MTLWWYQRPINENYKEARNPLPSWWKHIKRKGRLVLLFHPPKQNAIVFYQILKTSFLFRCSILLIISRKGTLIGTKLLKKTKTKTHWILAVPPPPSCWAAYMSSCWGWLWHRSRADTLKSPLVWLRSLPSPISPVEESPIKQRWHRDLKQETSVLVTAPRSRRKQESSRESRWSRRQKWQERPDCLPSWFTDRRCLRHHNEFSKENGKYSKQQ